MKEQLLLHAAHAYFVVGTAGCTLMAARVLQIWAGESPRRKCVAYVVIGLAIVLFVIFYTRGGIKPQISDLFWPNIMYLLVLVLGISAVVWCSRQLSRLLERR